MFVLTMAIWSLIPNTLMQALRKLIVKTLAECRHLPHYLPVKYMDKEPEELRCFKYMMLHEPGAKVHQPRSLTIWNLILST